MRKRAFSLVECLVVITIIALLAAFLFPITGQARGRAGMSSCTANLRQLGSAILLYESDNNGRLPLANLTKLWDDYGKVPTPEAIQDVLKPYGVRIGQDGVARCPYAHFDYTTRFVFSLREEFGTTRMRVIRQVEPDASSVLASCVHHLTGGYSRFGGGFSYSINPNTRQGRLLVVRGDGSVSSVDTRQMRTFQVSFASGSEEWKEIVPYEPWSSQQFPNTDRIELFPGETWPIKWVDIWKKP